MVTEVAIGRKTQKNPVGAFVALGYSKWKFVGMSDDEIIRLYKFEYGEYRALQAMKVINKK